MASGAAQDSTTPDVVLGEHRYKKLPNARPTGQELVPDQAWTTWRLRNQRPELVADMPKTFPDISKYRYEEANQVVETSIAEANAERAKEPRFRKRSFEQLRDYRPVQLTFRPLHEFYDEADRQLARRPRQAHLDDSDDDDDKIPGFWFDRLSFDLFTRVWQFASDTFEFVKYASEVARGDPVIMPPPRADPNNWEYLFLAKDSRVLLIVGIIAKILEENVFDSLLFGATPGQKQALNNIDNEMATLADSYARNYPRSGVAKQFVLAGRTPTGYLPDLYTDNYWDEVDSVTMSILSLLLPLINMLGELSPEAGWPALTKVHQELHDIVAEAGWLTNGMRVSKSIFWVQFPEPGDLWDIHQEHVMDIIWKNSKAAATRRYEAEAARWEADMVAKWRAENAGETVDLQWRQAYEQNHPPPSEPRRTAKVQIVLWPWIDQYSPVQPKSDGNLNSGETITHIVKAQIVYYAGDESGEGEARERLTLEEHIRKARGWKLGGWSFWAFLALFIFSIISLRLYGTYQTPYLREAGSRLRRAWQPTTESLRVSPTIVVSVDVDLVLPPTSSPDPYVAAETVLSAATSGDQTTPWITESSQTDGSYTTTSSSTDSAKLFICGFFICKFFICQFIIHQVFIRRFFIRHFFIRQCVICQVVIC
ncbi:hypothetical protein VPNG_04230 [Cytospora leucostoma]|uniref:Uncharacterized protein n=1 Tax=Cytospora leucostoma TaxID=1230097 RepID=A0A423XDR0_9PEZI|nr:hypothetical protein VPNG_04230 [Cytospora leucostoma]